MGTNFEHKFEINQNSLEELNYVSFPAFPFFAEETIHNSSFIDTYPWHWHSTIQFFYVTSGKLMYTTPNGSYVFRKGHGGFINANILHMLKYPNPQSCSFVYFMINPELIGINLQSDLMLNYIRPIIDNSDFDIFHLDAENPKHQSILEILKELYTLYLAKEPYYELEICSRLFRLWILFDQVTQNYRTNLIGKLSSNRIKLMITYMNEHYVEKISLDQIAEAGMCSKRECNRSFQTQLHTTPFEYLLEIRLQKACYYLVNTSYSITDISISCGFGGTSYFIKLFREKFGYSPKEYRKNFQSYHPDK